MPIDDAWKDEILERPSLSGVELLQMPSEHRSWVYTFPHVWVPSLNQDCLINLLHKDNARYKRERAQ